MMMNTPPQSFTKVTRRSLGPLSRNLEYRLRRVGLNDLAQVYASEGFEAVYEGFPIAHRILSVRPEELGSEDSEAEVENLARAVAVAHPEPDRDRFLGNTVLEAYLRRGGALIETVRLMILGGADPSSGASTIAAALDGSCDAEGRVSEERVGEMLDFLIRNGADPATPNAFAALCRYGLVERAAVALEAGADPNIRGLHDRPLIAAARAGHTDIVRLLLDNGALPDLLATSGFSPLCEARSEEIVRLLVERGANMEIRHADGSTPLLWAAAYGTAQRVQLFIELGANLRATTLYGVTALQAAQQQFDDAQRVTITSLLRMSGVPEHAKPQLR